MSLTAKINSAVDKAFKAAGDLVVEGQLSIKNVSNYDFSLRQTIASQSSVKVNVILQSIKKPSGEGFTVTAIMKSGISIGSYDTITINGVSYNILDYHDDGFVINVILFRGKA